MAILGELTIGPAIVLFAFAAMAVWSAGTRLPGYVAGLADHLGLQQGFAGMLFLGGITSLPEVATAGSAALTGSADLAVSNLLGTSSVNIMLLVFADALLRRRALAATVLTSAPLIQGMLGMLLMTAAAVVALVGDEQLLSSRLGYGTTALLFACAAALLLASRFEKHPGWTPRDDAADSGHGVTASGEAGTRHDAEVATLAWKTAAAAAVILVAGFVLAQTGDVIARISGLGAGLTGLVLVGFATSLPELSSVLAAVRLQRFEMAIGDVLGTNIFNVAVLFLVDLAHRDGPVLAEAGLFEGVAALLAVVLTGLLVLGMLVRRDKTFIGVGPAAWTALAAYVGGLALLWAIEGRA